MKRKKIILWSVFAVSAICLTPLLIEALLEKNFRAAAFSWIMISVGFFSVKHLLNKDKQENNSVPADL